MKKEEVWKTVGISALTSVIVFLVLYFAVGGVMMSPPWGNIRPVQQAELEPYPYPQCQNCEHAKACDADGTCEVRSLVTIPSVRDNNGTNNTGGSTTIVGGNIGAIRVELEDLEASGQIRAHAVSGTYGVSGGWIQAVTPGSFVTLSQGDIQATGLRHEDWQTIPPGSNYGFAYACLDAQGNFFRSETPC